MGDVGCGCVRGCGVGVCVGLCWGCVGVTISYAKIFSFNVMKLSQVFKIAKLEFKVSVHYGPWKENTQI